MFLYTNLNFQDEILYFQNRHHKLLFFPSVSTNDSESYMNEEKKEDDLLNKCMQSMSIEEQGEHLMLT